MSENTTTSNPTADGDCFPSLTALRNAHSEMLTLHREKGNEPEIIAKIEQLINKGRATGALLDSEDDRWAAQSLLDYWNSLLYRAGHEPPDAILVDLDLSLIPDIPIDDNAIYRDIQTPRPSGLGSVAIGGNAQVATIMTGNNSIISNKNNVQAGKYNINIAEGSNIKIGDTIYQGTDVKATQTILIGVLNKFIIDNTFQKLFPPSKASSVDWEWGMKLLKQKQLPEIRKRLADNLGRDRILMDVSIEEQQNWVNRFPLAADQILQIDDRDCGTLDANKMLIETFGRDDIEGKLLILGAPGAGKTTALLSLAEQLVEGAISQRGTVIPVIFELSTWGNDDQSIESWLIEEQGYFILKRVLSVLRPKPAVRCD
jgi:hypothetical protein